MVHEGDIRVAVIGAGHLGTYHARIYSSLPHAHLVGVVDIIPERAEALASETGCRPAAHLRDLPPVEAVSVATPTSTHLEVSRDALQRGCHVLVEKPLAPSVDEGRELVAAAEAKGLILGVGYTERFNPAFTEAARKVGEPRFIEAHRLSPFVPRSLDVDVVLDLMSHDLDLVLALVGAEPTEVHASGVGVLTTREDIANARLRFEGGIVANLTASRISREKLRKIRLFGNGQYVSVDLLERKVQRAWLSNEATGASSMASPWGVINWEALDAPPGNPLAEEIGDFLSSISRGEPTRVSGADGLRVLAVAHQVRARVRESLAELGLERGAPGTPSSDA